MKWAQKYITVKSFTPWSLGFVCATLLRKVQICTPASGPKQATILCSCSSTWLCFLSHHGVTSCRDAPTQGCWTKLIDQLLGVPTCFGNRVEDSGSIVIPRNKNSDHIATAHLLYASIKTTPALLLEGGGKMHCAFSNDVFQITTHWPFLGAV